jgi:hypothetical protein
MPDFDIYSVIRSAEKVVFLVQLDFERNIYVLSAWNMKHNPKKPCTSFLVQPHSGLLFTTIFPGAIAPGYSQSTPFGVSN